MATVGDLVPERLPVVPGKTRVRRAIDVMVEAGADAAVVTEDDGSPVGLLTETDIVRRVIATDRHPFATTVESVMSAPVVGRTPAAPSTRRLG